jgi:hypothetical protein
MSVFMRGIAWRPAETTHRRDPVWHHKDAQTRPAIQSPLSG